MVNLRYSGYVLNIIYEYFINKNKVYLLKMVCIFLYKSLDYQYW